MNRFLIGSFLLVVFASCLVLGNQQAFATPFLYNNTAFSIPWTVQARNSSVNDIFVESGYNGTITSWYHNTIGAALFNQKLGSGTSSFSVTCATGNTLQNYMDFANGSSVYYICPPTTGAFTTSVASLNHYNILTSTNTHDFSSTCTASSNVGSATSTIFPFQNFIAGFDICLSSGTTSASKTTSSGNVTLGSGSNSFTSISEQKIQLSVNGISILDPFYDYGTGAPNPTSGSNAISTNKCELQYTPTNATESIDSIACDFAIPQHALHFWHGYEIHGFNGYSTNSTYPLIQSVLSQSNNYRKILTMNSVELGIPTESFTDFILHANSIDYMVVLTSSNIYYAPVNTVISQIGSAENRASQTYFLTSNLAPTNYPVPDSSHLLSTVSMFGPAVNSTISTTGVQTLVSPYTMLATTNTLQPNSNGGQSHVIRTLDPQWTNNNNIYPIVQTYTGQTMFQTFLTVSNAPQDAGLMATNPYWAFSYSYEPNLISNFPLQSNLVNYASNQIGHLNAGSQVYLTNSGKTGLNFTGNNYVFGSDYGFPKGANSKSISIWIYPVSTSAGNLIYFQGTGQATEANYIYEDGSQKIHFASWGHNSASSTATAPLNTWTNVILTFDGTTYRLYINGVADITDTITNMPTNIVNNQIQIGWDTSDSKWMGILSNLKVYNIALSSAQVANLYSTGQYTTTTNNYGTDGDVWSVTRMDSTRSAEFDTTPNVCSDIWIADISVSPAVYNYQGATCATGANTKSIAYTSSLPLNFYNFPWGATDSFVPSTNTVTTTVRSTSVPFTYTETIASNNGTVETTRTFTASTSPDTQSLLLNSTNQPDSLKISVGGNQIFSDYLGSSFSLASTASFFHQYFNYQGFDLLSFIPLVFASAFTRNSVGVGVIMVVVLIASLNFFSIVTLPPTYIYIMALVGVISMIGYRSLYG